LTRKVLANKTAKAPARVQLISSIQMHQQPQRIALHLSQPVILPLAVAMRTKLLSELRVEYVAQLQQQFPVPYHHQLLVARSLQVLACVAITLVILITLAPEIHRAHVNSIAWALAIVQLMFSFRIHQQTQTIASHSNRLTISHQVVVIPTVMLLESRMYTSPQLSAHAATRLTMWIISVPTTHRVHVNNTVRVPAAAQSTYSFQPYLQEEKRTIASHSLKLVMSSPLDVAMPTAM
jgi:hypothetical protein